MQHAFASQTAFNHLNTRYSSIQIITVFRMQQQVSSEKQLGAEKAEQAEQAEKNATFQKNAIKS